MPNTPQWFSLCAFTQPCAPGPVTMQLCVGSLTPRSLFSGRMGGCESLTGAGVRLLRLFPEGPPCSFSLGRLLVSRTICLLFLERPPSRLPASAPPAHSAQSVVKACVCVFVQCPFSSLNTELHEGRDSLELCIWGFLPWPARDRSSSCSVSG